MIEESQKLPVNSWPSYRKVDQCEAEVHNSRTGKGEYSTAHEISYARSKDKQEGKHLQKMFLLNFS
jgi:hypothetical protein